VRNFAPDRWPLGVPVAVTERSAPTQADLESNTYAAFADMDASPTKAWLVLHRNDPQWKRYYDIAFAKRPGEELYDLRKDPYQTNNVAADPRVRLRIGDDVYSGQAVRITDEGERQRAAYLLAQKYLIASWMLDPNKPEEYEDTWFFRIEPR